MQKEFIKIEKSEYDFLIKLKSYVVKMYQCESSDAMDYYDIILEKCPELKKDINSGEFE